MEKQEWMENIIFLQARCRGYLIRKDLRSVQDEFEDIVRELEGSVEHLQWRGQFIPKPCFTDRESALSRYHQSKIKSQGRPEGPEKLVDQAGEDEKSILHSAVLEAEKDKEPRDSPKRDGRQTSTSPESDRQEGVEVEESLADRPPVLSSMALEMSYSSLLQKDSQMCSLLKDVAHTPEALKQHRKTLAMELLWIQQAIASRKKYLTLKQKIEIP